jgi:DNA mismatch repair protein MutS
MFESPYQPESIALEGLERYGTVFTYKANKNDATPMMRQFLDVKEQYRDLILLYRMGDFYETFFEDAVLTARHLELTLTGKDCGALGKIPMAGVPVKSVDVYVPRLLNAGFKIALCEQMEDPATAKGLVKREVVRILSAGTVNESQQLTPHNAHYLAAVVLPKGLNQTTKDAHLIKTPCALAYVDISTGRFCVSEFPYAHLLTELDRLAPQELLVQGVLQKSEIPGIPGRWMAGVPAELQEKAPCTPLAKEVITQKNAYERIAQWLNVSSLEGYGLYETDTALIQACGMIVHYLNYSFLQTPLHLDGIQRLYADKQVRLSANARKHLELLPNPKESSSVSLFQILNRCMTPMGQRLLKDWVACPTHFLPELESRLEAVEDLVNQPHTRQLLRQLLPNIYDLERLATRLANLSATPRELGALAQSLKVLPRLSQTVLRCSAFYLERLKAFPPEVGQALALMENALQDELPATLKEGGIIRAQFSPTLDELRHLVNDQAQWIDAYEAQEREVTGIKHLKVQFTNATGYFIEVSKGSVAQVPERYRPKQSLTNATRFMTPELKAHESAVWDAQNRLLHVESDLFLQLRRQLLPYAPVLKEVAHRLACLDVLQSFAEVAQGQGYTRPCLVETPILELQQVRHPVIEQQLPKGRFVPNNTALAGQVSPQQAQSCPQVEIITGPNMAGKSTYMRQVALCVLMAHIGCFVPATHATIGVVDAIFTRIGAMDNVSKGQSTFMVEMAETAEILNTATAQSLVILDEVGRGTSTYDGVAIAWSVVEHLVEHVGARTLFATHYHELNVLELAHPALVQNVRMVVAEQEGELVFLHRVEAGAAQKSYGIQVARMAGLPSRVLQQATGRLNDMQKMANHQLRQRRLSLTGLSEEDAQLSIF